MREYLGRFDVGVSPTLPVCTSTHSKQSAVAHRSAAVALTEAGKILSAANQHLIPEIRSTTLRFVF